MHCDYTSRTQWSFTTSTSGRWTETWKHHENMQQTKINPLNAELNPICHLLALLVAHVILHVSRIRVKLEYKICRSQWPRVLRCSSAAAHLLRSWVRIPPGAWIFVCCECCVLSGRGLCDELITRPEESYRLWCVIVYDLENLKNEETMTSVGSQRMPKQVAQIAVCSQINTKHINTVWAERTVVEC